MQAENSWINLTFSVTGRGSIAYVVVVHQLLLNRNFVNICYDAKAASRVVLPVPIEHVVRRFMTMEGVCLDKMVWRNEAPSSTM